MSEETLLEFPCRFPIKAMGINTPEFESLIVMIGRQHIPDPGEAAITFTATSKPQIDNLYRALNAHPDVKFVL